MPDDDDKHRAAPGRPGDDLVAELTRALKVAQAHQRITLGDVEVDREVAEALPGLPARVKANARGVTGVEEILIGTKAKPHGLVHTVGRHAFYWTIAIWFVGIVVVGLVGVLIKSVWP